MVIGAGPAGLELVGEIKAFFPEKHVTIADASEDILTGPYDQPLDNRRDQRGYVRVDEHLRVVGETHVFALGDVADADRDMAGIATAEAGVVAANVRVLITGAGELTRYDRYPPLLAIPLGPNGGAGFLGDGVADAATISDLKGRGMLIDRYTALFDATAADVAA